MTALVIILAASFVIFLTCLLHLFIFLPRLFGMVTARRRISMMVMTRRWRGTIVSIGDVHTGTLGREPEIIAYLGRHAYSGQRNQRYEEDGEKAFHSDSILR